MRKEMWIGKIYEFFKLFFNDRVHLKKPFLKKHVPRRYFCKG